MRAEKKGEENGEGKNPDEKNRERYEGTKWAWTFGLETLRENAVGGCETQIDYSV